ncbi:MAG TPA: Rieske (2Fe-2S) protein [Solirubrobacteraceae bacterium]|nr:Rieske (2Fe-2S) protein [Solirubrobacteraceae bacterium]
MADEPIRLIPIHELEERGVVRIDTPRGRLAVGIADGQPFAVSDRCRHLGASLGEGTVTSRGCLRCPWHGAEYDVRSGRMTRGPQGIMFMAVRDVLRASVNIGFTLRSHPVVERDGVLYLAD